LATWSAPGKVFLFGEHAVVYGKPAIAMAIKPRVFVTVRRSKNPHSSRSPYIDSCFEETGVKGSVYIHSQLPSSSGLGSSAAVTVATLSAINDEFDLGYSVEKIADMAFGIEKKVQKGKASPTDTSVVTFGGIVFITDGSRRRLPPEQFNIVVGNSLIPHNTAKMVESVADFKKRYPTICEPLMDSIGALTICALHQMGDLPKLGRLMNVNHSLLESLGVGHPAITRMVLASRAAGAFGAKITGAGGGGCMIALCAKTLKGHVEGAIESCEGRAMSTTLDTQGVRKEKDV